MGRLCGIQWHVLRQAALNVEFYPGLDIRRRLYLFGGRIDLAPQREAFMIMLISCRSVVGGLGLVVAVGLAQRSYARLTPTEFRVGYQKAGLLSVANEQGVFERRLKPLDVLANWSKFKLGPPMMDAISTGAIDFGWLGDRARHHCAVSRRQVCLRGMYARIAARAAGATRIAPALSRGH
jgi:hypothetical protein